MKTTEGHDINKENVDPLLSCTIPPNKSVSTSKCCGHGEQYKKGACIVLSTLQHWYGYPDSDAESLDITTGALCFYGAEAIDFQALDLRSVSKLESTCHAQGSDIIFLPKYYCELNFIEQCWGHAK
ncbi:hypothetical protein AZE42_13960, partial [Rhizopogon vesiculosus]